MHVPECLACEYVDAVDATDGMGRFVLFCIPAELTHSTRRQQKLSCFLPRPPAPHPLCTRAANDYEKKKQSFDDQKNYIEDVTDADFYKCIEINGELPGASQLQVCTEQTLVFTTQPLCSDSGVCVSPPS